MQTNKEPPRHSAFLSKSASAFSCHKGGTEKRNRKRAKIKRLKSVTNVLKF